MTKIQKSVIFVGVCGFFHAPGFLWLSLKSYDIASPMYYCLALWTGFLVGVLVGLAGVLVNELWNLE